METSKNYLHTLAGYHTLLLVTIYIYIIFYSHDIISQICMHKIVNHCLTHLQVKFLLYLMCSHCLHIIIPAKVVASYVWFFYLHTCTCFHMLYYDQTLLLFKNKIYYTMLLSSYRTDRMTVSTNIIIFFSRIIKCIVVIHY